MRKRKFVQRKTSQSFGIFGRMKWEEILLSMIQAVCRMRMGTNGREELFSQIYLCLHKKEERKKRQ